MPMRKKWWPESPAAGVCCLPLFFVCGGKGGADGAVQASGIVEGVEVQIISKVAGAASPPCAAGKGRW